MTIPPRPRSKSKEVCFRAISFVSLARREYFDLLLPIEGLDFATSDEILIDPIAALPEPRDRLDVRGQTDVRLQEIPLIKDDPDALAALRVLREKGYSFDQVREAYQALEPVPVTKVRLRQAKRANLDMQVKTEAARILHQRGINPEGQELDRKRLGRTNLIVLKSAIDRQLNAAVGGKIGERSNFTRLQLDYVEKNFAAIVEQAVQEVFNAPN
jgi:hypothetical protein